MNQTFTERLNAVTFSVHHSPSCPKHFQVRLIGPKAGRLDNKQIGPTQDVVGHGDSLEEAAKEAWMKKMKLMREWKRELKKKYDIG